MDRSIKAVQDAAEAISDGQPFADELRAVLYRAASEAQDDRDMFDEMGKFHLRTFLKTTPLGLAILDLADAILDAEN